MKRLFFSCLVVSTGCSQQGSAQAGTVLGTIVGYGLLIFIIVKIIQFLLRLGKK